MMPVIRVSDHTLERLKKWAEPLVDTPDDALRKVLDAADEHRHSSGVVPQNSVRLEAKETSTYQRQPRGRKVPQQAFNDPILESLHELGGKAHASQVLQKLESKMKDVLGEYDYEALPSGDIRWQKTANWARYWLTKRGMIRADSERGVWELTAQGRADVENKKGKHRR